MVKKREVNFQVDAERLDGTIFYPDQLKNKNPAILFITGWTSNRARYEEVASLLTQLGFICLTFDMRGHGTSEGNIQTQTRAEFLNDVKVAYDQLANLEEVDSKDINLVGSSFGSYLAAILPQHRRVHSLALRVPANYPDADFDNPQFETSDAIDKRRWRHDFRNPQDTISLKALHNFDGKVLIVESGKDEIIPAQTVANYLNAVKDKKKLTHIVMEAAPHSLNTLELGKKYNKILYDWLKQQER